MITCKKIVYSEYTLLRNVNPAIKLAYDVKCEFIATDYKTTTSYIISNNNEWYNKTKQCKPINIGIFIKKIYSELIKQETINLFMFINRLSCYLINDITAIIKQFIFNTR